MVWTVGHLTEMMTHPSTASLKPMNIAATLKYFALSDWHDALTSARAAASSGLNKTNPELSSAWHAAASSSTEAATMAKAAYWVARVRIFEVHLPQRKTRVLVLYFTGGAVDGHF